VQNGTGGNDIGCNDGFHYDGICHLRWGDSVCLRWNWL